MKHLKTFENFDIKDKNQHLNLNKNKVGLENSDAFSEMSEKDQEIIKNAYKKDCEEISDSEHLED